MIAAAGFRFTLGVRVSMWCATGNRKAHRLHSSIGSSPFTLKFLGPNPCEATTPDVESGSKTKSGGDGHCNCAGLVLRRQHHRIKAGQTMGAGGGFDAFERTICFADLLDQAAACELDDLFIRAESQHFLATADGILELQSFKDLRKQGFKLIGFAV